MMKRYTLYIWMLISALLSVTSCTDNDFYTEEEAVVTFRPTLEEGTLSRAIGDGSLIDQLLVKVFEGESLVSEEAMAWKDAKEKGITLELLQGRSYQILFWAQDADNKAYTLTNDGKIGVVYADYQNSGFSMMEQMDAFYATEIVNVGKQKVEDRGTISLTRPLAQLNLADNTTKPVDGTHKAVVTFHSIPTSFDPFTGEIDIVTKDVTFTFTDFPNEMLNSSYYYISSNYFFAPATGTTSIEATLELQQIDGTPINTFEFKGEKAIALERNKKTNVLGAIVQQPEVWSVWDGKNQTEPTKDNQNRYIIDEASDVAWLSENGASLTAGTFLQTVDIDMDRKTISSIKLPAGSTYDGGKKQIINYANSLFGDATKVSVLNLNVEGAEASGITHVGVLMNTLKGSATFTNVTIANSSAETTDGAAGGMIGYVVRTSEMDRSEPLNVAFSGCQLNTISVAGSASEGKFVGLLSGYDNQESITFDAQCQSNSVSVADYISVYTKANQSAWVTSDITDKYDGWLGHETYRRGKVLFGGVRMAPRWDGVTRITPLTDGTTKLIYSAFDLASLQGSGHTAVTFKEDVDLGGDRATNKNPFTPISAIGTLDGENHKLYNLNIFYKSWIVGFINGTSGTETIHKNLHFVNSSVRAGMTGSEAQVYVGTLCPYVNTKYTVSNITMTNGYVLGLGKVGGLIGFVTTEGTASLECNRCKVESSIIENIQGTYKDVFGIESLGLTATFNPHGEAGGLIGFLGNDATITECQVNNCNINCYGQDDQTLRVLFISYTIPGRHVNRFIGDIMTISGDAIVIKDCSATGNTFGQRKEDRHSYRSGWSTVYCDLVGRAYYLTIRGDTKGSVKIVNGTTSTTIF